MGATSNQCKEGKGPKQGSGIAEMGVCAQNHVGRAGEKPGAHSQERARASAVRVGVGPCLPPFRRMLFRASSLACIHLPSSSAQHALPLSRPRSFYREGDTDITGYQPTNPALGVQEQVNDWQCALGLFAVLL